MEAPKREAVVRRAHAVATGLQGLHQGIRAAPAFPSRSGPSGHRHPSGSSSASAPLSMDLKALTAFKRQRRWELAEQGKDPFKDEGASSAWKELSEEERDRVKLRERERERAEDAAAMEEARRAETVSAAGAMLKKLREQESRVPTAAETRARLSQETKASRSGKRKHKDDKMPEIARPVFPQRQEVLNVADRADRRREKADTVRTRTEENKASVTIASSARVSLTEVSAQLSAPTLSCDWARRDDSDDEDTAADSLTVDMPADSEARKLMDDELRRKISSAQVRRLVQTEESEKCLQDMME